MGATHFFRRVGGGLSSGGARGNEVRALYLLKTQPDEFPLPCVGKPFLGSVFLFFRFAISRSHLTPTESTRGAAMSTDRPSDTVNRQTKCLTC